MNEIIASLSVQDKLETLSDAAKYDVAFPVYGGKYNMKKFESDAV